MSAFRLKFKAPDARDVARAYEDRRVRRMLANGSSEQHAYEVMAERRQRIAAAKAQRQRLRDYNEGVELGVPGDDQAH